MKVIFDENSVIVGKRNFDIVFDDQDGDTLIRVPYRNVKSAIIYKGTEIAGFDDADPKVEYLQLTLENGKTATYENKEVRLYHC